MPTEARDVVDIIREQHTAIRRLFVDVANAAPSDRGEAFQPLVRLLAVHETAEEEVVYPAISGISDSAASVADERKAEEDQATKALATLEGLDPSTAEFMVAFAAFQEDVEQHARNEELSVLPLIALSEPDQRQSMGEAFDAAEALAPTHPHPMAPRSVVGSMFVGPFIALADRVRDAIRDARR